MILWISGVILLTFAVWYWFWRREQFFIFLRGMVREIVRAYKLEHPDVDLRDLQFEVVFKDKKKRKGNAS